METSCHSPRQYPPKPGNAYLFATCLVDQFAPEAGLDTVRLLEREGIVVHFPPDQTCCGQPAYTSGYPDEARAVARRQLDLFPEPWPVVVPSGSCAAMMRHHYPKLFADDAALLAKARELSQRVFELTEFLVHVAGFKHSDSGQPCTIALHTSCHARREMGSHETSATLLAGLAKVRVEQQARSEECCGFGGTFSIREPDISAAIVSDKVDSLCATGAERVVSADCGCLFNILGRAAKLDQIAGRKTPTLPGEHIASFLWRRTSGKQA
ncbi:MAG: (Fe-S)-binding protein [Betaproteobacteria bacterium]|nr:(Fe-S)-binding protein [Betaproteobacteria bacterium]